MLYDYGPDRLLSLNNITEGVQFYLFDALGSVVNLTRPDGAIQTRIQYDAWGNVRNQVGSSANEFGFTGHEMDEESNLIYMKARFYDPELGQFLSQDAAEGTPDTPPSLHKYLYAYSNPTVYFDPDGNQTIPSPEIVTEEDLKRARTIARQRTIEERKVQEAFENEACGKPNKPPQCVVPDEKLVSDVAETYEDTSVAGSESPVTEDCNDPMCEYQRETEKYVSGPTRRAKDAISKTGDVIDVVVTPDETDIAFYALGPVVGNTAKTINRFRKGKKALKTAEEVRDVTKTRKLSNKELGILREQRVQAKLESKFGKENVLRERLLLDKYGKEVKDPITGKGRRIDYIVLNNDGTAKFNVEVTSRRQVITGGKAEQIAKETRIKELEGIFIRNPATGRLVDVSNTPTRVVGVEPLN